MSDISKRLREAHPNSAQYFAGSNILLEAAVEIERLEKERDYAIRWANKAVEDVKASYEAELANARIAALDQAAEAASQISMTWAEAGDINLQRIIGAIITDIRALKAEGESR